MTTENEKKKEESKLAGSEKEGAKLETKAADKSTSDKPTGAKAEIEISNKADGKPTDKAESKPEAKIESKPEAKSDGDSADKNAKDSSGSESAKAEDKKEAWKKKFLQFADRRQHTVAQNLRLAGVIALIVFLIGIFQPLVGVNFGISIKGDHDNNPATAEMNMPLFSSGSQFAQFNIGDMAMQKPLYDYKVFGNELDEIEILGLKLYDFAKAPFPDFSVLKDVDQALDSESLQFLTSPKFAELCYNFLGDQAESVISIANTLVNLATNAGDVLDKIINVFTNLSAAKASLNAAVVAAENAVSTANGIMLFCVLIMLAGIVLFIIGKGPRYLSPIILTPFTAVFLVIGIGLLVGNGIIQSYLAPLQESFNSGLKEYLLTAMPQVYQAANNMINLDSMNLVVVFSVVAGLGWWLTTLSLAYVNVTGYVLGKKKKGAIKSK